MTVPREYPPPPPNAPPPLPPPAPHAATLNMVTPSGTCMMAAMVGAFVLVSVLTFVLMLTLLLAQLERVACMRTRERERQSEEREREGASERAREDVWADRCAYATDYRGIVTYFEDLILFFHGKDDCSDRTDGEEERPRVRLNVIAHAELALERCVLFHSVGCA